LILLKNGKDEKGPVEQNTVNQVLKKDNGDIEGDLSMVQSLSVSPYYLFLSFINKNSLMGSPQSNLKSPLLKMQKWYLCLQISFSNLNLFRLQKKR
jgi:hypothetical protein